MLVVAFWIYCLRGVETCNANKGQFVSRYFLVDESNDSKGFILNLKQFNKYVLSLHFQMERIRTTSKLLAKGSFMASLDTKDAYFLIPVHEAHRKCLHFSFLGQMYQLTCLSFGLTTSPYVFTKVMKSVMSSL